MKITSGTLLRLGCYLSLAISFMPIVDYYSPWYITLIPVVFTFLVTLRIDRNIFPVSLVLFAILGLWLLTWWTIYYHVPVMNYFVNFFVAFVPCIISVQLNRTVKEPELFQGCLRMMAVFVGITCITTIIGLVQYPMASRELASGTALYNTLRYRKMNIGGYEFIYALVLLIPVLFWMIRHAKGGWRGVYIFVLMLDMLCIYASQYTIALVCVVIAWIALWMQENRRAATIVTLVLLVFLWFDGLTLLGQLFHWASEAVSHEYVSDRLLQASQLFSGQSVHTETSKQRIEYYMNQVEAFRSSPVLGHNWFSYSTARVSGHSLILDVLGGAGIFGAVVLIVLFRGLYRLVINPKRKRVSPYVMATWTMAIVVATLNTVIFSNIITIAFMCCMCINKIETSELRELVKG